MKLELLIDLNWVELPENILDGIRNHYGTQGTPIHFDSEKYQFYVRKLENTSSSYCVYRVEREKK